MDDGSPWERAEHVYTTTVLGGPDDKTMTLVAIPGRLLADDAGESPRLEGVIRRLGFELLASAPQPAGSFLPHAVASALAESDPPRAVSLFNASLKNQNDLSSMFDVAIYSFAMHIVFSPIVGIEESRMKSVVMGAIIGIGGQLGFAAASTIAAPVLVAIAAGAGVAAGTIIVLSTAVAIGERIYEAIAPR